MTLLALDYCFYAIHTAMVQFNILFPDRFTVYGQDAKPDDPNMKVWDAVAGVATVGLASFVTVSKERFVQLMTLSIMTRSSKNMIPVLTQLWKAVTVHFTEGPDTIETWMSTLADGILDGYYNHHTLLPDLLPPLPPTLNATFNVEGVPKYALEWIKYESSAPVDTNKSGGLQNVVVKRLVSVDNHTIDNIFGSMAADRIQYIETDGNVTRTTKSFEHGVTHEETLVERVLEMPRKIYDKKRNRTQCERTVIPAGTYDSQLDAIGTAQRKARKCVKPLDDELNERDTTQRDLEKMKCGNLNHLLHTYEQELRKIE